MLNIERTFASSSMKKICSHHLYFMCITSIQLLIKSEFFLMIFFSYLLRSLYLLYWSVPKMCQFFFVYVDSHFNFTSYSLLTKCPYIRSDSFNCLLLLILFNAFYIVLTQLYLQTHNHILLVQNHLQPRQD